MLGRSGSQAKTDHARGVRARHELEGGGGKSSPPSAEHHERLLEYVCRCLETAIWKAHGRGCVAQ
eukprot:15459437-Alexandrium_andersonii.AAC.1